MSTAHRLVVLGCFSLCVIASGVDSPAAAASIPYPTSGLENANTYTFKGASSGDLSAYQYVRSGAGFTESLGLLVNGHDSGVVGVTNKISRAGDRLDFGTVSKGDVLTFYISIADLGGLKLFSDAALNPGGHNQVYAASFAGNASVPAGTYVGFEDLDPSVFGVTDFNYRDEEFVFTNTTATTISSVPLPASAPMFGAGLLALAAAGFGMKRRKAAASA